MRFVLFVLTLCIWAGSAFGQNTCVGCTTNSTSVWSIPPSKTVKPLTNVEKASLAAARKKLEAAQEELASVELSVRTAHSERHNSCDHFDITVTFFGDYALVDVEPKTGCISSGTFLQMNTVPSMAYPMVSPTGTAAPGGLITAQ